MKLLDWMHRKFRQSSSEPFKDLVIGNSCNCLSGQQPLDDEQIYQKPNLGVKLSKHAQKGHNLRNSFAGLEAARVDEEYEGEPSAAAICDLFPGFLAIGTLGSEQVSDPSTPSFPISVESITEKDDEVTENDLKLINEELEKVLGAETKDDVSIDSSRRTSHVSTGRSSHVSHVSTGRSSHVSIITLSGKPIEGTEPNGNGAAICPLQGYLFGTAIELSETTASASAAKKEHRTSLGELFQRSKSAEENISAKCEKEDKKTEKEVDKSTMNLMKEKLKKRMLHAYSKSSTSVNGGPVDSASAETKLNKILHMFRKKVHPESSTAAQKSAKHHKNQKKKKIINDGGHNKNDMIHPEEDSSVNREYWIKTDADYLVLEL